MTIKTRAASILPLLVCLCSAGNVHSGTITGIVRFVDSIPKLSPIRVSKDQDYCGETLQNETYLADPNGGLKNVVISLDDFPVSTPPDSQKLNIIENNACRYAPRVLAMQKGERLKVRNTDPKLHIPHSYLQEKTVFMLSLPFRNTILDATPKIRDSGIMKLVCDTHAWMLGYVHVFEHQYFAVTDDRGIFAIGNVPGGTYTLRAWHEDAGVKTQEITVPEHGEVRVPFEFSKKSQISTAFLRRPTSQRLKYSSLRTAGRIFF